MSAIVITTVVVAAIVWFDVLPKYKNKEWRLFWISSGFLLASYIILVLAALHVAVPSPVLPMERLAELVYGK